MSDQSRTHWPNLPAEIRNRVLDFVFLDRVFSHFDKSSGGRRTAQAAPVLELSRVSKEFATYHDIVNAIIQSGKIRIHDVASVSRIAASLASTQRHMMKTLLISKGFLEGLGSASGVMKGVPGSIGNFKLDVPSMLQVYVSVSKHSSIAKVMKRAPGDPFTFVDWEDDIANGFVSKVEAESMLLDACVKDFSTTGKDYTGLGALLSYAASHEVGLQTEICITFVERQTSMVLAKVDNARLSTKDWCIRVPLAGDELVIDQTLAKDCLAREEKDVRRLLGYTTPRRYLVLLTLGSGLMAEYKWVYWYQTSALKPWI